MKKVLFLFSLVAFANYSFSQSTIANGAACPNFTVTDVSGNSHTLSDICAGGQYVIVDFFAYWCGPCMATAPYLEEFYTKYGCNSGDVFVLAMESDPNSTLAQLQAFKESAGVSGSTMPTVLGSQGGNGVRSQYGVSAFPTFVLIGPDMNMINNDIWPISGVAQIEAPFPNGAISEKSCSSASLDQNELDAALTIYPNPVATVLTIAIDEIQQVNIVDASGKIVFNADYATANQIEISVSSIETGMYFLNITTTKGIVNSKFTKL